MIDDAHNPDAARRALNAERDAARQARRTASQLRSDLATATARIADLEAARPLAIRGRRRNRPPTDHKEPHPNAI